MIYGGENWRRYKHLRRDVCTVCSGGHVFLGKPCVATSLHTYIQARTGGPRVDEVGAYGVAGSSLERAFRCAESLSASFS